MIRSNIDLCGYRVCEDKIAFVHYGPVNKKLYLYKLFNYTTVADSDQTKYNIIDCGFETKFGADLSGLHVGKDYILALTTYGELWSCGNNLMSIGRSITNNSDNVFDLINFPYEIKKIDSDCGVLVALSNCGRMFRWPYFGPNNEFPSVYETDLLIEDIDCENSIFLSKNGCVYKFDYRVVHTIPILLQSIPNGNQNIVSMSTMYDSIIVAKSDKSIHQIDVGFWKPLIEIYTGVDLYCNTHGGYIIWTNRTLIRLYKKYTQIIHFVNEDVIDLLYTRTGQICIFTKLYIYVCECNNKYFGLLYKIEQIDLSEASVNKIKRALQ